MLDWFASLTAMEQVFAYVAFPATLLLLLQTVLLLFGLGDNDADADVSHHDGLFGHDAPDLSQDISLEADHDLPTDGVFGEDHPDAVFHGDSGLRLFTLRGIVAFFAVLGWTGLTLSRGGIAPALSLIFATLAGFGALFLVAYVMKWLYKSQHNGNMDLRNALGVSGTVYITIPPARQDQGKVNLMLQGQFCELSAVTDQETPIATGTEITVVGISGASTLVVKRK